MSPFLWRVIILGILAIVLLNLSYFAISLPYYYRAGAGIFGFLLLFVDFLLFRVRWGKTEFSAVPRTLRLRTSFLLTVAGSVLAGAILGITVYDANFGINDTLYKLSENFNINSPNAQPVYIGILALGMALFAVGCIFFINKLCPNPVKRKM